MLILCFSWSKYIYLAVISEQVCKITNKFSNGKRFENFSSAPTHQHHESDVVSHSLAKAITLCGESYQITQ